MSRAKSYKGRKFRISRLDGARYSLCYGLPFAELRCRSLSCGTLITLDRCLLSSGLSFAELQADAHEESSRARAARLIARLCLPSSRLSIPRFKSRHNEPTNGLYQRKIANRRENKKKRNRIFVTKTVKRTPATCIPHQAFIGIRGNAHTKWTFSPRFPATFPPPAKLDLLLGAPLQGTFSSAYWSQASQTGNRRNLIYSKHRQGHGHYDKGARTKVSLISNGRPRDPFLRAFFSSHQPLPRRQSFFPAPFCLRSPHSSAPLLLRDRWGR